MRAEKSTRDRDPDDWGRPGLPQTQLGFGSGLGVGDCWEQVRVAVGAFLETKIPKFNYWEPVQASLGDVLKNHSTNDGISQQVSLHRYFPKKKIPNTYDQEHGNKS